MKANGFSLWLMPEKDSDAYHFMQSLIEDLAEKTCSPVFAPHMTLLGSVAGSVHDVLVKTKELARQLMPLEVELVKITTKCKYFRGFFAKVRQSPEIIDANRKAQRIFAANKNYFPHASLSYWDLSEAGLAKLQEATTHTDISRGNFTAGSIHLYRTEGEVSAWGPVKEFPLNAC